MTDTYIIAGAIGALILTIISAAFYLGGELSGIKQMLAGLSQNHASLEKWLGETSRDVKVQGESLAKLQGLLSKG